MTKMLRSYLSTLVFAVSQDDGKGGLSLRGVAVMTKTATTAETAKTSRLPGLMLHFVLSGPICGNRFAIGMQIANILCELFLRSDLPENGL